MQIVHVLHATNRLYDTAENDGDTVDKMGSVRADLASALQFPKTTKYHTDRRVQTTSSVLGRLLWWSVSNSDENTAQCSVS